MDALTTFSDDINLYLAGQTLAFSVHQLQIVGNAAAPFLTDMTQ
jgi:hypothetical protein